MKKVMILGYTGKMGAALYRAFTPEFDVIGLNSKDFDATNHSTLTDQISIHSPDIVINTVAALGIEPCELDPMHAFDLNTRFPRFLSDLSNRNRFQLIHFSTDAVFPDRAEGFYSEQDSPNPLNVYGATKLAGDWAISGHAKKFIIARIPILFGPSSRNNQFVEKMLMRIKNGDNELSIANDIITTPSYSPDIAKQLLHLVKSQAENGLYHISNSGAASLYELMVKITDELGLSAKIHKASYKDFPSAGTKNTYTPLTTHKGKPLRSWHSAVKDYCTELKLQSRG